MLSILAPPLSALETIFADGFETGGVQLWSSSSGFPDTVPPEIEDLFPTPDALVASAFPEISARYGDTATGIEVSAVVLKLDGVDRTFEASVGASSVSWTPAEALAQGPHSVSLLVADRAGNPADAAWAFAIDSELPTVDLLVVSAFDPDTSLLVAYGDSGSGVDLVTLRVQVDGADVTARCTPLVGYAVCDPGPPLSLGPHLVSAEVRDFAANLGQSTLAFSMAVDSSPPVIRFISPPSLLTNMNDISIEVEFSDTERGVDESTFQLSMDGMEVSTCTIGSSGAQCSVSAVPEGQHQLLAAIGDLAGNGSTEAASFVSVIDHEGPEISALPVDGSVQFNPRDLQIEIAYQDSELVVNVETLTILLDGVSIMGSCLVNSWEASCPLDAGAPGVHHLEVGIEDTLGNPASLFVSFEVVEDLEPPSLEILSPPSAQHFNQVSIDVVASLADSGSGVDGQSLRIWIDRGDVTATCAVAGGLVTCAPAVLNAGQHEVAVEVGDLAGLRTIKAARVEVVADTTPPAVTLVSPSNGILSGSVGEALELGVFEFESGLALPTMSANMDGQEIVCTPVADGATCILPALTRGAHVLTVEIADTAGNLAEQTFALEVVRPVGIAIASPLDELRTSAAVIRVEGTVDPGVASVEINGEPATLAGTTFEVAGLPLHDGTNFIEAIARDASGAIGFARVYVLVDRTPPDLTILEPSNGALVHQATVDVVGLVNDLTLGTINAWDMEVQVNGAPASVANRSFVRSGVVLVPGPNVIEVVATSSAGVSTRTISIEYEPPVGDRIEVFAGNGQAGSVSEPLAQPLVVRVSNEAGAPIEGRTVVFRVVAGNGSLNAGKRAVAASTDAYGQAEVSFQLGDRSGPGANRVRATAAGVEGAAVFLADAEHGEAAQVLVASGANQRGSIGEELAVPLTVVVLDAQDNPVEGVDVTFAVVDGSGTLSGQSLVVRTSDGSGRARARLRLGSESGFDATQSVWATIPGAPPAVFLASALHTSAPEMTAVSGSVLDNQGEAVPGVTIRLRDRPETAVVGANGVFSLSGAFAGHQYLIVDPSTAHRPGNWAILEFELFVVPGVDNPLERPIYILPLDTGNGLVVSEATGGAIELADQPGFRLEVAPGSAVFPGGGRSGVISASLVHPDRIPMAPAAGMQPRIVVTIQPVGTLFDPPARLTLPNLDALTSGSVTEMFSFDHDLGAFVAIGTGTVSEDGLTVTSDPGFGVLKAGWHCAARPNPPGTATATRISVGRDPKRYCLGENGVGNQPVAGSVLPVWTAGTKLAWSIEVEGGEGFSFTRQGVSSCSGNDPVTLCPRENSCGTRFDTLVPGIATLTFGAESCDCGEPLEPVTVVVDVARAETCWLGNSEDGAALVDGSCVPETRRHTVSLNDDDDDQNGIADRRESPLPLPDNDAALVIPREHPWVEEEYNIVSWKAILPPGEPEKKFRVWLNRIPREEWKEGDKKDFADVQAGLLVEGILPSRHLDVDGIELHYFQRNHGTPGWGEYVPGCQAVARFTIYTLDLDVDSDNDDGLNGPEDSELQDAIENTFSQSLPLPGKLIQVNDNDDDGDGIADFADGFTPSLEIDGDQPNLGEKFVPLRLSLPELALFDFSAATLRLAYGSPLSVAPTVVTLEPTSYDFEPEPSGSLRLWKKSGNSARDARPAPGGDFAPDGIYLLSDLGFSPAVLSKEFFLEATHTSVEAADQQIRVSLDPDGPNGPLGWVVHDAVRLTAVGLIVTDPSAIPPAVPRIHGGGVAWISPEPEMPRLEAVIEPPFGAAYPFQCEFNFNFNRSPGRIPDEGDLVLFPALGDPPIERNAGVPWIIWQSYGDLPESKRFFGGDGSVRCTSPILELETGFRIRGRNPDPAAARAFIQSQPGAPWYAYAIARHESGVCGEPTDRRYNQFDARVSPSRYGRPCFGEPDGWGIMQLDLSASDPPEFLTTSDLWDWRRIVQKGVEKLSSKVAYAERWMNSASPRSGSNPPFPDGQRPQAQVDPHDGGGHGQYVCPSPGQCSVVGGSPVPVPREPAEGSISGHCVFLDGSESPIESAVAIKAYNGATENYCRWDESPNTHGWAFSRLNSAGLNYVERVCEQVQ